MDYNLKKKQFTKKEKSEPRINCNVAVIVQNGNIEGALKAFKNKYYNYGIVESYKESMEYLKPSFIKHKNAPNHNTIKK